jgi:hypothetical protein
MITLTLAAKLAASAAALALMYLGHKLGDMRS